MPKIVALITACGRGNRFNSGEGIPKQYLSLAGFFLNEILFIDYSLKKLPTTFFVIIY